MSTSVLQFPAAKSKPETPDQGRPLFLDPDCPFHFSETPFVPGQPSTAHALAPAQQFAVGITCRLYRGLKNPKSSISLHEDLMQTYLAAAYNAGYAAALDAEFADALAEMDTELGTR